jgi:hypothetical protein
MMVVGEQLSSHLLTVDLMLIQELQGSHNSEIWNYPFWLSGQQKQNGQTSQMMLH